jgi:biopolymer transport protein ExbB/TolQ
VVLPEGERLARLEEQVRGVREDMAELVAELGRGRQRLHKLEGGQAVILASQDAARKEVERRQKRLEWRLQILTVVIAVAAVVAPIVSAILITNR